MEKQLRYLIGNKVLSSDIEFPKRNMFPKGELGKDLYNGALKEFNKYTDKLPCDECELDKIVFHFPEPISSYIDITSITTVKDGKVYFKEVDSESNEAIEFKEWSEIHTYKNKVTDELWSFKINSEYYPNDHKKVTTKELYEIFETTLKK